MLFGALLLVAYEFVFFFQAEDGIRDGRVTGVQTCALPIWSRAGCPSVASATSTVHHSRYCTTLAMAWSAVASPVGRYGVLANALRSSFLASWLVLWSAGVATPRAAAASNAASARAEPAAAARSRSPGDGGESTSTATVATAEASHQPASRSGSMLTVPAVTTDSTK